MRDGKRNVQALSNGKPSRVSMLGALLALAFSSMLALVACQSGASTAGNAAAGAGGGAPAGTASAAAAEYDIEIAISAPEYDASKDALFPLFVEGTTAAGDAVGLDVCVPAEGATVSLAPGEYKMKPTASPLLHDGRLYNTPITVCEFKVDANGKASKKPSFAYSIKDASEVTAEDIEAAAVAALASGVDQKIVTDLQTKATKLMDEAKGTEAEPAPEPAAAAAETPQSSTYTTYWVAAGISLTLRDAPSTSAAAIESLPYNTPVSFIENSSDGFAKVSHGGNTGYVLASFLSPTANPPASYDMANTSAAPAPAAASWYCIASDSLTLRTAPDRGASAILSIPSRASVAMLDVYYTGEYSRVRYGGYTGFVLTKFLSTDPNAPLNYATS